MTVKRITIHTKWDRFGYVATSPDCEHPCQGHNSGPRAAAEELAKSFFGSGNYHLRNAANRTHYVATQKQGKWPVKQPLTYDPESGRCKIGDRELHCGERFTISDLKGNGQIPVRIENDDRGWFLVSDYGTIRGFAGNVLAERGVDLI